MDLYRRLFITVYIFVKQPVKNQVKEGFDLTTRVKREKGYHKDYIGREIKY